MDTFICSSWYFLRYTSPRAAGAPFEPEAAGYWMPVDQYIGGIEHAVLHLLYARFFTKVLYDAGLVNVQEPFTRLLAQGMVYKDGAKMSKSKGNVVSPDEMVLRYGADTGRLFILFAAPPEKDLDWSDQGVEGCHRFLRRAWRLVAESREIISGGAAAGGARDPGPAEEALRRAVHTAIRKVTLDIQERFNFNTAISAIMELVNAAYAYRRETGPGGEHRRTLREALTALVLLLAPFAPHLAEEAWEALGGKGSVHLQPWPGYDPSALQVEEVEVAVQVNGKVRGRVVVPADCSEAELLAAARANRRIGELLEGKELRRAVTVPGRLVNLIVN
jgi:leucyl-tRNA synthetase